MRIKSSRLNLRLKMTMTMAMMEVSSLARAIKARMMTASLQIQMTVQQAVMKVTRMAMMRRGIPQASRAIGEPASKTIK